MLHRGTILILALAAAVLLVASHLSGLLHSIGEDHVLITKSHRSAEPSVNAAPFAHGASAAT